MKIIKKILLPLVLFLGLFFNSSTVFASNNLSASFSVNNDELTIKVKNTSGKEVSDVEYNLNLPSEYTANYTSYPKYTLAPNEETSFKVKVANSDIKTNDGVKEKTKSYPATKKLSNTGEASQTAVGIMILLLLAVGLLLYFKQRKLLIIIITVGLGTQLLPSYSFAAEKVKFSEHFDDKVVLFNNNTKVSLDISYLIEGNDIKSVNSSSKGFESTNSSKNESNFTSNLNDGNSNKTNKNSGTDNVKSNEKDSKEVLVAGYALAGKTSVGLENKKLKIFDGDKEIATVVTDSEGYFFTHLVQDKTYTIKGEDFEVTLTAKNNGDYTHNDVVGKINLGRVIQDENTYIKVNPSVAFISEDTEYKVDSNLVTIDGEFTLNSGDKLVLSPSHNYLSGFAFIVDSSSVSNGKTSVKVTPVPTLQSIVDDFKYKEEVDISSMKFIPSDGVNLIKNMSEKDNRTMEPYVNLKVTLPFNEAGIEPVIELKGKMEFDFSLNEKRFLITPKFEFNVEGKSKQISVDKKNNKEFNKEIGKFSFVTYTGLVTSVGINFLSKAEGKLDFKSTLNFLAETKMGFENNAWVYKPNANTSFSGEYDLNGKVGIGFGLFGELKLLNKPLIRMGPSIETLISGKVKAGLKYKDEKFEVVSGEVKGELIEKVELNIIALEWLRDKLSHSKIFNKGLAKKELSAGIDVPTKFEKKITTTLFEVPKKDNNNIYKDILDKYKTAISGGIIDPSINLVAVNNYFVWGKEQVGDTFLNYGFYDINKDGKDELLLFTESDKNRHNDDSPMDVYTRNKDNKPVRLTPEGVNGERTTMKIIKEDSNFIVRGSGGAWRHGYDFYKLKDSGTSIEKTDSFSSDTYGGKPEVYERTYPTKTKEVLTKEEFNTKYLNKENMKFDYSKRESITK